MDIDYKSNRLRKSLTNPAEIIKSYGTFAKKINQRMQEMTAAANLSVLKTIPGANCHVLSGDRSGQFAVNISGNRRIIFEPNNEPLPSLPDGSTDFDKVTAVKILSIEDYH
ncbi:MAG: killer suppression protein HigA [Ignavibacteriae bacterium]|nr:killer suppression protein HigA [Ignavibacteriota bacterium]